MPLLLVVMDHCSGGSLIWWTRLLVNCRSWWTVVLIDHHCGGPNVVVDCQSFIIPYLASSKQALPLTN